MKRIIIVVFALIVGVSAFSGCTKKDNSTGTTSGSGYKMAASIGSTPFSWDSCAYHQSTGGIDTINIINGFRTDSFGYTRYPTIDLYFAGKLAIGTYTLGTISDKSNASYITGISTFNYSVNGSITITAVSPNVVGTFNFNTDTGPSISNGSFTAQIQ